MQSQTNAALAMIITSMKADAEQIMSDVELALGDIGSGRRNGAIGALAPMDTTLERLASLLAAVRAIHRTQPF
jgi:hypothetical protein